MVEYVVQDGDSLSLIAEKVLGDQNRWPEIYNQNLEVIGSDPNVIFPGAVLQIGEAEEASPGLPFPWFPVVAALGLGGVLYAKGVF